MAWQFFTSSGKEKVIQETVPAGIIAPYAGATAPDGWLFCDGSTVSRTTCQDLFNKVGTLYGSGNGSSTFHLPDMRGRTPIGIYQSAGDRTDTNGELTGAGAITTGSTLSTTALGYWQGAESITLTSAQSGLPSHGGSGQHSISSGSHNHSIIVAEGTDHTHGVGFNIIRVASNPDQLTGPNDNGAIYSSMGSKNVLSSITGNTSGISIDSKAAEDGSAHSNVMPSVAVNFIIKI